MDDIAERLLSEAVGEGLGDVVREAVHEMAEGHLQKASAYDVATDLMNECISELMPDLVSDLCELVFRNERFFFQIWLCTIQIVSKIKSRIQDVQYFFLEKSSIYIGL